MNFAAARLWQKTQCMIYSVWVVKAITVLFCLQCFAISTSTQEESPAVHPAVQWCVLPIPKTRSQWWHNWFFSPVWFPVLLYSMMQMYTTSSPTVYCCPLMKEFFSQHWRIKEYRKFYVQTKGKRERRVWDMCTRAAMGIWTSRRIQLLYSPVVFSKAYNVFCLHGLIP